MKVYEATVIDKCASPSGEEPMSYESYVAVGTHAEIRKNFEDYELPDGFTDEDIHFYFDEDVWNDSLNSGDTIEREEFKYLIGKRVV